MHALSTWALHVPGFVVADVLSEDQRWYGGRAVVKGGYGRLMGLDLQTRAWGEDVCAASTGGLAWTGPTQPHVAKWQSGSEVAKWQ
jgi:hypothetical protein